MVIEDLCITIPSYFKCPISLDVMKSPVSLTTGVTYDRSSIQTWLDNGNNTCPATMQVLQTKDFVPNLTLQRLIQLWSNSARANSPSLSRHEARVLVKELENKREKTRFEDLSKIVCFARKNQENCVFLARIEGFVDLLVEMVGDYQRLSTGFVEQILKMLHPIVVNSCTDKNKLVDTMLKIDRDRDCLSSLLVVLRRGDLDSKIAIASVLEFIAIDAQSKLLIADKENLLTELLNCLNPETDQNLTESVLSCLISIAMPKRIKVKIVQLGAIKSLTNLLSEQKSTVSITEKALKLLEMMCSVKEGRSAICENTHCVSEILEKVLKVSNIATEHSVMILWSICYLFRDAKAQEVVAKSSNGLTKILLLMQSNCSATVRQMSGDLLKIFRVCSKSCLSSYETKTTHIMPF